MSEIDKLYRYVYTVTCLGKTGARASELLCQMSVVTDTQLQGQSHSLLQLSEDRVIAAIHNQGLLHPSLPQHR